MTAARRPSVTYASADDAILGAQIPQAPAHAYARTAIDLERAKILLGSGPKLAQSASNRASSLQSAPATAAEARPAGMDRALDPLTCVARISRRHFLGACAAGAGTGALDAFALEPNWLEVTEHSLAIPGLAAGLEGLTLAQITDVHLKSFGRVEEAIVQAARRHSASIVALTGDIVDHAAGLTLLGPLASGLRGSGAAMVAILGNWEHWSKISLSELGERYAAHGVRLLVNESVTIEGVSITGTDDHLAGHIDWKRALEGAPRGQPRLLLTHSPDVLDRAPESLPRFDFAIAGHTHGGQARIGPWAPLVPPGSGRFVAGRYETPLGPAYVSRGTGTSVLPARFSCRPELPIFRLQRG